VRRLLTAGVTARSPATRTSVSDLLDLRWDLNPRVSIRPESFGALLYHFGTRRLSFLKDRRLLDVLRALPDAATAREACLRVGIAEAELATYARALSTLAATDMLQERS
jgi:putative mycofactocin binding protein MftB